MSFNLVDENEPNQEVAKKGGKGLQFLLPLLLLALVAAAAWYVMGIANHQTTNEHGDVVKESAPKK